MACVFSVETGRKGARECGWNQEGEIARGIVIESEGGASSHKDGRSEGDMVVDNWKERAGLFKEKWKERQRSHNIHRTSELRYQSNTEREYQHTAPQRATGGSKKAASSMIRKSDATTPRGLAPVCRLV